MKTDNNEVIEFGTLEYLKSTWKDLFNRRKSNRDSLTKLRMRELAKKIQDRKAKQ